MDDLHSRLNGLRDLIGFCDDDSDNEMDYRSFDINLMEEDAKSNMPANLAPKCSLMHEQKCQRL